MTNPIDIPAALAICEAATEGKAGYWDALAFIAAARPLLPTALHELEAARENLNGLTEPCPSCSGTGIVIELHDHGTGESLGCFDCEGTGRLPRYLVELADARAERDELRARIDKALAIGFPPGVPTDDGTRMMRKAFRRALGEPTQ